MLHQLFILCILIAARSGLSLRADDPDRDYFDDNLFKRGRDISLENYDDDDLDFRNLVLYPENYLTERELDYDADDDDNDDNDVYAREIEKDQDRDLDSFPTQKRKNSRRCKGRKKCKNGFCKCKNGFCKCRKYRHNRSSG